MADSKIKDSLMKLLLSSGPSSSLGSHGTPTSSIASPQSDQGEDNCPLLSSYLNQINASGQNEVLQPWEKVYFDHNYARSGSDSNYHSHVRPTKTLFMTKTNPMTGNDDFIDVTTEVYYPSPPYDINKAHQAMEECEKYINETQEKENEIIDWEEMISRNSWTPSQSNLFSKAVKILHADRLARLATSGDRNEPILRRLSVNKSAQRFREILGSVMWDVRLTQWLHAILIENLNASYLVVYLDILQTLKSKIQSLIEKMMANHSQLSNRSCLGSESLNLLLKRPWDPTTSSFTQHKLRKLPGNPIMLLVPSGIQKQQTTSRMQIWNKHLSNLGTLINLSSSLSHLDIKLTSQSCLAQMITTTKGKLAEIRSEYPRRPIILIGWRAGASLACQVAVTEIVTAVVCLGFSANTVEGPRGEPDDSILDVQCPVLFVTGEHSASSRQEDLEEIREKMKVQTGLLVVGSADDCLRMGKTKKKVEKVTQSMVDRCILEEIGDFLAGVLTSPKPLLTSNELRRSTFARRRHNSTTSSVDSESSTAKRSRPATPQSQTQTSNSNLITKDNGNTLKTSTLRAANTRGRRSINVKKSIIMNSSFHSNQVNPSNGGITVNIGNLASLGPLGSLRLNPNTSTLAAATNVVHHSQSTSKINSQSVIEAAPPEEVMPFSRNNSEGFQSGSQNLSKSSSRLAVNSESSTIGQQNFIYSPSLSPAPCLSVPSQTNISEEKKPGSLKHVLATNSKTGAVTQSNRGTTLQLIDKLQMNKPIIHSRSPTTSTIMNAQSVSRHQIRSVTRNPIIIKTTPGAHSKAVSPANRGQKLSLTQNGGKLVTTTGANIILLESNSGQNRPVIVPFSGSSSKITPQSKTTPQKIQKLAQTTKASPITKFSISKKIISSSSLLPQRPVLLRNKSTSSALGTSGPATKSVRADNSESSKSSPEDLLEIPVYYGEGVQSEMVSSNQQEDHPVVIPIIDSSKLKSAKKSSYPKDVSYADDGDSISFPLDCDIDSTEEEGVKVLISSLNRVVKPQQIFITKSGSNVKVKKLKSFMTDKPESEESQDNEGKEGQVILGGGGGGGEEAKYFINYTEDNEEGVLYEIMEDN